MRFARPSARAQSTPPPHGWPLRARVLRLARARTSRTTMQHRASGRSGASARPCGPTAVEAPTRHRAPVPMRSRRQWAAPSSRCSRGASGLGRRHRPAPALTEVIGRALTESVSAVCTTESFISLSTCCDSPKAVGLRFDLYRGMWLIGRLVTNHTGCQFWDFRCVKPRRCLQGACQESGSYLSMCPCNKIVHGFCLRCSNAARMADFPNPTPAASRVHTAHVFCQIDHFACSLR